MNIHPNGQSYAPKSARPTPEAKQAADEKRLKEACCDFEGIFLGMMLKSMRGTLSGDAMFGGGMATDVYESMKDQYMVEEIARGGNGLGLSDALYRELSVKWRMGSGGDPDPA